MNEFTESIRSVLYSAGELAEILLNALSLLAIISGIVVSLRKSLEERRLLPGDHPRHTIFRRNFGGWLVVALEFQMAADIVGTIISPTYQEVVILGAIAVIRTLLNYFLVKELNEENESITKRIEKSELRIEKT